jgi:O-antigen ligase
MLTHLATTAVDFRRLLWFIFAVGGVCLAWQGYEMPWSSYRGGRLEGMGGPDFADNNIAATHFVCMGVIGAVLLFCERGFWRRAFCLFGGALIVYTIVATRSRAGFLGMISAAVAAMLLSDHHLRRRLVCLLPLFVMGAYALTDEKFWTRMETITASAEERDRSAAKRIEIWKTSLAIAADHPFGIGAGNFFSVIGRYEPRQKGFDTHNAYLRCLTELGIPGMAVFTLLIANAFCVLGRCRRSARQHVARPELFYWSFGLQVILVVFLTGGMTLTLTYTEGLYLFLLMPVALERTILHAIGSC